MAAVQQVENEELVRFCHAYLYETGGNATEAYLAIRPQVKRASAAVSAKRLLSRANTKQILNEMRQQSLERMGLDADDILQKWVAMSEANMMDYMASTEDGYLVMRDLTELPKPIQQNITQLEVTTDRIGKQGDDAIMRQRIKLRIVDRKAVLDSMARVAGLFAEQEDDDQGNIAKAIEEGFARVAEGAARARTIEGELDNIEDGELVD